MKQMNKEAQQNIIFTSTIASHNETTRPSHYNSDHQKTRKQQKRNSFFTILRIICAPKHFKIYIISYNRTTQNLFHT